MKMCRKCRESKPLDQFHRDTAFSDGHKARCKECVMSKRRENPNYRRACIVRDSDWQQRNPINGMLAQARKRAKRRGLECSITLADIQIPTHCPVLGIELMKGMKRMHDASPSLDRINSKFGYVPGNVAVISNRANRIKNDATVDEIIRLGQWLQSWQVNES